jgi:hypothetical protein
MLALEAVPSTTTPDRFYQKNQNLSFFSIAECYSLFPHNNNNMNRNGRKAFIGVGTLIYHQDVIWHNMT